MTTDFSNFIVSLEDYSGSGWKPKFSAGHEDADTY